MIPTPRSCETCHFRQEHDAYRTGQACTWMSQRLPKDLPFWFDLLTLPARTWPVRLGEGFDCPAWVTAQSGVGP